MDHHHLMQVFALLGGALIFAKLLGGVFDRMGVPTVLAELTAGIILGNLGGSIGHLFLEFESSDLVMGMSELGVLFLLFVVGLETDIKEIGKVGVDATLAAILGVVGPFALAFLTLPFLFSNSFEHHLFMAAALTATSVGITARVLQDSNKLQSVSGQIILGAAVIDDILGVIILTVVSALVIQGTFSIASLFLLIGKVFAFGIGIVVIRKFFMPRVLKGAGWLQVPGTVTILLLSLCLLMAYLADVIGLAGIIGAFALGIILDDVQFQHFREAREVAIEKLLKPVLDFFTPIFFIFMGMGVKIDKLASPESFGLGILLIVCAIIGKFICGLGVRRGSIERGGDRALVGFGMIPRGEVGLIFASMGLQTKILNQADYASVVLMVVVTTLMAPALISWRAKKVG